MPIQVTCAQCQKSYSLQDTMAGKQAKCKCGATISVPAAGATGVDDFLNNAASVEGRPQPVPTAAPAAPAANPVSQVPSFDAPAASAPSVSPVSTSSPLDPLGQPPSTAASVVAMMAMFGGVLLLVFAIYQIWMNWGHVWNVCYNHSFRIDNLRMRELAGLFGNVLITMAGFAIGIGGVGLFVDGIMGLKGKRPSMIWADFIGMFGLGLYFIVSAISLLFTLNNVLLEGRGDMFPRAKQAVTICLAFFLFLLIPVYFVPMFLARKKARSA